MTYLCKLRVMEVVQKQTSTEIHGTLLFLNFSGTTDRLQKANWNSYLND